MTPNTALERTVWAPVRSCLNSAGLKLLMG